MGDLLDRFRSLMLSFFGEGFSHDDEVQFVRRLMYTHLRDALVAGMPDRFPGHEVPLPPEPGAEVEALFSDRETVAGLLGDKPTHPLGVYVGTLVGFWQGVLYDPKARHDALTLGSAASDWRQRLAPWLDSKSDAAVLAILRLAVDRLEDEMRLQRAHQEIRFWSTAFRVSGVNSRGLGVDRVPAQAIWLLADSARDIDRHARRVHAELHFMSRVFSEADGT